MPSLQALAKAAWEFLAVKSSTFDPLFANTDGTAKTLTTGYVNGTSLYVAAHSTVRVFYDYTKGAEASADIEFLYSHDNTNWYPNDFLPAPVSGVITPDDDVIRLTASRARCFALSTSADLYINVRAKGATGATGTLRGRAVVGMGL